jgi:hypothetical protein
MSRRDGDRTARSRGPSGDATAARDAGAPHAVVGVPSAARSRCAGPSGDAPGRPPRSGDATPRRDVNAPCTLRSSLSPPLPDPAYAGPSGNAPARTREAGMRPSASLAQAPEDRLVRLLTEFSACTRFYRVRRRRPRKSGRLGCQSFG